MKTMNNTNALSKSSIRTSRMIAKALDKLGAKLAKRLARLTENEHLSAMQVVGNIDDPQAFDAVVRNRSKGL